MQSRLMRAKVLSDHPGLTSLATLKAITSSTQQSGPQRLLLELLSSKPTNSLQCLMRQLPFSMGRTVSQSGHSAQGARHLKYQSRTNGQLVNKHLLGLLPKGCYQINRFTPQKGAPNSTYIIISSA